MSLFSAAEVSPVLDVVPEYGTCKPAEVPGKGRGLIAAAHVPAGGLLLCEPAVAAAPGQEELAAELLALTEGGDEVLLGQLLLLAAWGEAPGAVPPLADADAATFLVDPMRAAYDDNQLPEPSLVDLVNEEFEDCSADIACSMDDLAGHVDEQGDADAWPTTVPAALPNSSPGGLEGPLRHNPHDGQTEPSSGNLGAAAAVSGWAQRRKQRQRADEGGHHAPGGAASHEASVDGVRRQALLKSPSGLGGGSGGPAGGWHARRGQAAEARSGARTGGEGARTSPAAQSDVRAASYLGSARRAPCAGGLARGAGERAGGEAGRARRRPLGALPAGGLARGRARGVRPAPPPARPASAPPLGCRREGAAAPRGSPGAGGRSAGAGCAAEARSSAGRGGHRARSAATCEPMPHHPTMSEGGGGLHPVSCAGCALAPLPWPR
ncbi:unnamed protein product [Prorocentrum cordatum]|uniref:Uncharacterized protein n=1 Tax=Prorocentrum cordatum TaxID=2364126 RepID=A0ABN9SV56_9DINO|nr:unnamed protein product [Polarella glacialis]